MNTATDPRAELKKKLVRKAYRNKELRAQIVPLLRRASQPGEAQVRPQTLTATQRVALAEAVSLVNGMPLKQAAGAVSIDRMPGFSGMQLRQHIDRVAQVRREIEIIAAQYEAVLKQMKDLEKEEKAGLDKLKTAAGEMRDKGKFCAEAESSILEFTAYLTEKRPGIEQMIATPEDSKWGEKAGDFFGRVAAKLGKDMAEAVEALYVQTKEDLTHTTMAVRGLKVVSRTAGIPEPYLKQAGIADAVVSVKEWLAGKARNFMGFMGDVGRWVKGFVERTKMCKKANTDLKKSIGSAKSQIDKLLAGAL